MLNASEINALSDWCRVLGLRWTAVGAPDAYLLGGPMSGALGALRERGHAAGGELAVLLEPVRLLRCWQRMVLICGASAYELLTETGEMLASASDLQSVLDALEGGVAEAPVPAAWGRVAPSQTRVSAYVL